MMESSIRNYIKIFVNDNINGAQQNLRLVSLKTSTYQIFNETKYTNI